MLEGVVIVVVSLTTGEHSHDGGVTCGIVCAVGAFANGVTKRVNEKGAVLNANDAENSGKKESTKRANAAIPEVAEEGGEDQADDQTDPVYVFMLPHDESVAAQVTDVIHWRFWLQLEHQPADVGPDKALGDIVRVVIVIDMFMVAAMVGRPIEA